MRRSPRRRRRAAPRRRRDLTFDEDREALLEELRAEREAHAREAEAALAAESGEARRRDGTER